ncbi:MAG: hypothetical protein ABEJ44_03125 [Halanaeroarchaeum sp.]
MTDETIVEDRGITVTKAFDREGFPVPAVTFRVESERTDPVSIRIVDEIPAEFGIEQIGFHPEYGSEHWTATGDGVVRFERTVDSGEAFTTVYGVKMTDDERAEPFLDPPSLEVNPEEIEDPAIEDVVPRESSDVVRELAGGERASVPGLDDEEEPADRREASEASAEASTGQAASVDDDAEILSERDEPADAESEHAPDEEDVGEDSPPADESTADESSVEDRILETGRDVGAASIEDGQETGRPSEPAEEADAAGLDSGSEEPTSDEPTAEEATAKDVESVKEETTAEDVGSAGDSPGPTDESASPDTGTGPIESERTMTEEPRDATSEDVTTGEETQAEPSTTDESGEDSPVDSPDRPDESPGAADSLVAALAEEIRTDAIDDEDLAVIREAVGTPTTSETVRLEHLQSRVSDLEAYTDELESFLDENGRARSLLDHVESTVDALADDIEDLESRVDSAQGEREALRERIDTISDELSSVDDLEAKIERIGGDLDALEDRVADGEAARMEVESLEDDLEKVAQDVSDLEDDVEEFEQWRSQLSDLFS